MRIIAGRARGRRLASPEGNKIRPTTDRVREALFSMLGNICGAVIVDGFAGSGALGLEALSRGAERCYFFDSSRQAVATIRENVSRVGVEDQSIIRRCGFEQGLERFVEGTPDLWFFDPPYGTIFAEQGLKAMERSTQKVTDGALVVWESHRDEAVPDLEAFEVTRKREYGTTRLVFFRCRR